MSRANPDPIRPSPRYASQTRTPFIIHPDALTGISTIDKMTMALTNILVQVMDEVAHIPGMRPNVYGIAVHKVFAAKVRLASLPGIGFWDVETTFGLEPGARYGSKGSIRTDVVLRNEVGDIIAIYDVKTGGADMDPSRVKELLAKTRAAPRTPVIQLHILYGASLKATQIEPSIRIREAGLQTYLMVRRI